MARARQSQAGATTRSRTRRTSTATARRASPAPTTAGAASAILAWEDDPGQPPVTRSPIDRPAPNLSPGSLPIRIKDPAPPIGKHPLGTPEFRYWAAADALARAGELWTAFLGGTTWQTASRPKLPVALDEGTQLNAFYSRNEGGEQPGLHFFHGTALGTTLFSGESPDVVCHEFGHAVLDAVRPELWDAMAGEIAAFHESFGDMSAMLTALRLPSFATRLLTETGRRLACTSRLSRLAEQLGWGIRQCRPDAVAPDCLREAANSFFYQPPEQLPPQAPAAQLSSEPHSLSRVFTAAFLNGLAGMFFLPVTQHDENGLAAVANDAGRLLIESIKASPVVPTYFSQIAFHMLVADQSLNSGKYFQPLARGFLGHGILSLDAATGTIEPPAARTRAAAARDAQAAPLATITVPAARFGLKDDLQLVSASQPKRFAVAGAAPDAGGVEPVDHDTAAQGFFEDLVRRGRVDFGDFGSPAVEAPDTRKTHVIVRERQRLILRRLYFDCGFDCCG
jgi:hypothetical protein